MHQLSTATFINFFCYRSQQYNQKQSVIMNVCIIDFFLKTCFEATCFFSKGNSPLSLTYLSINEIQFIYVLLLSLKYLSNSDILYPLVSFSDHQLLPAEFNFKVTSFYFRFLARFRAMFINVIAFWDHFSLPYFF